MNRVTINGVTFTANSHSSVSVNGRTIIIDGKKVDVGDIEGPTLNIKVEGVLGSLEADGDVQCGDVGGTVQAGGDVDCGNVGGTVQCGGNVDCGKISGSVMAGGGVTVR